MTFITRAIFRSLQCMVILTNLTLFRREKVKGPRGHQVQWPLLLRSVSTHDVMLCLSVFNRYFLRRQMMKSTFFARNHFVGILPACRKRQFCFPAKRCSKCLLRALFAKFHHCVNSFLLRLITHPFVSKQSQMFNILFACGLTDSLLFASNWLLSCWRRPSTI